MEEEEEEEEEEEITPFTPKVASRGVGGKQTRHRGGGKQEKGKS